MSKAKETYTVTRSEFTRQEPWILELLADAGSCLGFFVQFQSCFGRSAAPNGQDDFRGLYMSQYDMAALMAEAGIKVERKTVNNHLQKLTDLGIISKAPVCDPGYVEHSSKRIVWVYLINKTAPHEFDRLAEKIALEMLNESKYKGQAKASAAKKEKAMTDTNEIVAAREIARLLTEDNKIKGYIVNYLTNDGTVQGAVNAIFDLKNYTGRITENAFIQGTKSFKSAPLTQEQTMQVTKMRDHLNRARQEDKQPEPIVERPQIESKAPNKTSWSKSKEEIKAEDQMRRDDILAEKAYIAAQEQALKDEEFEKMLAELI